MGGEMGSVRSTVTAGLLMAAGSNAAAAGAEPVVLPSGIEAWLQEVRREVGGDGAPVMRFRFVAPRFSREAGFEAVSQDMEHLCAEVALPRLGEGQAEGARIIVSLADRATEFGVANREAAQVFEAYRVRDGRCIWEAF